MKRATFGFRMHSGWGVLVAISGDATSAEVEVIDRRCIVTIDLTIPGAVEPYHYAASLGHSERGLSEAEGYLANCAAVSKRLAFTAVEEVVHENWTGSAIEL